MSSRWLLSDLFIVSSREVTHTYNMISFYVPQIKHIFLPNIHLLQIARSQRVLTLSCFNVTLTNF